MSESGRYVKFSSPDVRFDFGMLNPAWLPQLAEFGVNSREGQIYDYKHGNPFTAGTFYVFEGQAFSFDYAGNVAWAAQGFNRSIPGTLLHLGAEGQAVWATGRLDDSWDQDAIGRGIRWSTRGR